MVCKGESSPFALGYWLLSLCHEKHLIRRVGGRGGGRGRESEGWKGGREAGREEDELFLIVVSYQKGHGDCFSVVSDLHDPSFYCVVNVACFATLMIRTINWSLSVPVHPPLAPTVQTEFVSSFPWS